MEGNLTTRQDERNKGEALASFPGGIGAPPTPAESAEGGNGGACAEPAKECTDSCAHGAPSSGHEGPAAAKEDAPGHAFFQSLPDSGESCSGNAGSAVNCGATAGFQASQGIPGWWSPGLGHQQGPPNPGPELHYGHHRLNPGFYGNPAFGAPMGGPGAWPHPGPGHHPDCFLHHAGMYRHPPQGPHFGPTGGAGFGYTEAPRHSGHGEEQNGRFADMVGRALQGQATPQDLIGGLLNLNFRDDQFWKGVVVGSVAALLLNSESVRQALTGALGSVFGKSKDQA